MCRTGERDVQRRERGDARLRLIYAFAVERWWRERGGVQGGERGGDRNR